MGAIIKAAQVLMSGTRLIDLTRPGSDRSREAREAALAAGRVIAGIRPAPVISLENYRWQRQYPGRRPRPAPGPYGCMDPRD